MFGSIQVSLWIPCELKRETDPSLLQLVYVYVSEMKENQ